MLNTSADLVGDSNLVTKKHTNISRKDHRSGHTY